MPGFMLNDGECTLPVYGVLPFHAIAWASPPTPPALLPFFSRPSRTPRLAYLC